MPPRPSPPPPRSAPTLRRPSRACPRSTRWPAATEPSNSARTRPVSCWPRIRPAGRKPCRWWTSMRPAWSSRSTDRCPTARTCRGCGMCASSTSGTPRSSPRVNAAPTSPCASGMRGLSTAWCTTPWQRSRPARRAGWRSSPTTPPSCSCNGRWRAMGDSTVRIGLVLPDVMGTYGDGGNAVVLRQRLLLREIPAEVVEITLADPVPDSLDLYTLGGAEDYAQRLATRHLIRYPGLQRAAERGAPVLAICAAVQVLGHWYQTSAGERIDGVGMLDATTSPQESRTIGELVAKPLLAGLTQPLTGFENHRGGTVLGPEASPLGAVVRGSGNRAGDGSDGVVQRSVVATYM